MTTANLVREGQVVVCPAADRNSLEVELAAPCGGCTSRCALGPGAPPRLRVTSPVGWQPRVGDRLQVAVSRSRLARSCAFTFGVPLAAWFAGAVAGSRLWGEAGGALVGLAAMAATCLLMLARRRSLRRWLKIELIALPGNPAVGQTRMGLEVEPEENGSKYAV